MRTRFTNAIFHTMENETDVHTSMTVEDGIIVAFDEERVGTGTGAVAGAETAGGGAAGGGTEVAGAGAETAGETGFAAAAGAVAEAASTSVARRTRVVDLGGKHVFPALIDAHLHLLDTIALSGISMQICAIEDGRIEPHDIAGVEEKVRSHAQALGTKGGTDKLVVFSNYITAGIAEGRLPNRLELDEWADGASVWVLNIDGHSSACSTALLNALGLSDVAPDGVLAGAAHDANLGKVTDHIAASVTPAMLGDGIADFCDDCASFGIGTVCALDGTDDSGRDRLTELIAFLAQRLPQDIRLFPQYMDERKLERVLPRMGRARIGGCMKWELDGSIGSRSAAFHEPFNDGSQGSLYFETDSLCKTVARFAERGFMITAHAIGECAIEQLVGVFERCTPRRGENGCSEIAEAGKGSGDASGEICGCGASRRDGDESRSTDDGCSTGYTDISDTCRSTDDLHAARFRIDHCEFPAEYILPRIYDLKPFITVQPGYAWVDKRFMHGYEQWLNEKQIAQQVPLRSLTEHGVVLCGSSDSPVQSMDPFLQMRGMREFYVEEESLSAYEALRTYTVNGGMMLGEKKGLLREGYEASFFTIDEDLLTIPPRGLENLRVNRMFLHGKPYRPRRRGLRALLDLLCSKPRKI